MQSIDDPKGFASARPSAVGLHALDVCVWVNVPCLGRFADFMLGISRGDLVSRGHVARTNPLPGSRVAVVEAKQLDAWSYCALSPEG